MPRGAVPPAAGGKSDNPKAFGLSWKYKARNANQTCDPPKNLNAVAPLLLPLHPDYVANYLVENESRLQGAGHIVRSTGHKLALRSIDEAFQFSKRFSSAEFTTKADSGAISAWAKVSPFEASKWMVSKKQDWQNDEVIHAFAGAVASESPEEAIVWACEIQNEEIQSECFAK